MGYYLKTKEEFDLNEDDIKIIMLAREKIDKELLIRGLRLKENIAVSGFEIRDYSREELIEMVWEILK